MKQKPVTFFILGFLIISLITGLWFLSVSLRGQQTPEELGLNSDEELQYWIKQIEQFGGKEAYENFKDIYGPDRDIGKQHERSHIFGEALYKSLGIDGVPVCDSNFGFGCYHSFFGFAILENGLDVLSELDQACIAAYGPKGLGCQHGIGHGVIVELGYGMLDLALEECSKLNWQGPIGGCTSGVLMEYNHHTMSESGTRQPEAGDYHFPCLTLDSRFLEACYFEQPAWWSALSYTDYDFIGEQCELAPAGLGREACYRGVGNVAAGITGYSLPKIQLACQAMPNLEGEILCIEGAAWLTSHEPGIEDKWKELCRPYEGEYYERCIASHDFI